MHPEGTSLKTGSNPWLTFSLMLKWLSKLVNLIYCISLKSLYFSPSPHYHLSPSHHNSHLHGPLLPLQILSALYCGVMFSKCKSDGLLPLLRNLQRSHASLAYKFCSSGPSVCRSPLPPYANPLSFCHRECSHIACTVIPQPSVLPLSLWTRCSLCLLSPLPPDHCFLNFTAQRILFKWILLKQKQILSK